MILRKYIFNRLFQGGLCKFASSCDLTYCKFSTVSKELLTAKQDVEAEKSHLPKKITRLGYADVSLSKLMLQVKSKNMRKKSNLIYFEGKRLLSDALNAGIVPLCIYFSRKEDIFGLNIPAETKLFKVPYDDLKLWSDLTTCPGVIVICERPEVVSDYKPVIPVSVICDNVREPGNLGSIIRNTAGAGIKQVYLSKGCIDLWDPKVIRGSMGALFRMPILNDVNLEDLKTSLTAETLFLIATNDAEDRRTVPYYSLPYKKYKDITLVIGGETEGISEDTNKLAELFQFQRIQIPLGNKIESLNNVSALSIILYEIKRQFEYLEEPI